MVVLFLGIGSFFLVYPKIFDCMPDICCRKTVETEVNSIYTQKRACLYCQPMTWVVESVYLGIELGFDYSIFLLSFPSVHHRLQIPLSVGCCYLGLSVGTGVPRRLPQCSRFIVSFQLYVWSISPTSDTLQ